MKWFVVDERKGDQLFIEQLDATTKEDAIADALLNLDRLTDREKKSVTLFYVMLADDIDGDPDFETIADSYTLFRDGHPVAHIDGNDYTYNDYDAKLTIDMWMEDGGALWIEYSTIHPHKVKLMTSDDQDIIEALYQNRDKEYSDMDIESYLKMLASKALEYFGIDPAPYMW